MYYLPPLHVMYDTWCFIITKHHKSCVVLPKLLQATPHGKNCTFLQVLSLVRNIKLRDIVLFYKSTQNSQKTFFLVGDPVVLGQSPHRKKLFFSRR